MRICVDCRMSGKSGIGAFIDGVLPHLVESGHNLVLLGDAVKLAHYRGPSVDVVPCVVKMFSIKELFFFPGDLLKIINSTDAYFSPYCNIPGGIKVPVFSTIHDVVFLDIPELAGRLGTFVRKMIYRLSIRRSKEIFTVSEFSRGRIMEKLKCRKPVTVVSTSTPEFFIDREHSAEKKDYVIFIGNIKKHKGLQTLIPAFVKFREGFQAGKDLPRLLIVGEKDNFRTKDSSLEKYIEDSEKNGIVFTGFVSNEDLRTMLREARILVQPSFYEGFGLPPLEALVSGTRALVSDIQVFREVYSEMPVTFFKTGDSDDLCKKLTEMWKEDPVPPSFENPYSFKRTTRAVIYRIEEVCGLKKDLEN